LRFGAAFCDGTARNAEKLLENAVVALDQARMRGLRYVRFDAANFPDPKVQLALTSDIGRGIERGEFSLVYQPKAQARDGRINGAEALIRWRHPEHGNIAPDKFIQVAEETGAIDDLTRWVLRQAIGDQQTSISAALDAPISINISGRLLANAGFCAAAIDAVQEANAKLCFEITETAIIEDPNTALASIAALRKAGIKISIDDYGSGLSSLAYLKQIAAGELKLDKSIIADIKTSARDRLILKSTIDLAHGLGMSVVAEGVEDEPTRALLAGLGCDTIQGYLVSRPLALADFVARVSGDDHSDSTPVRAKFANH
jgi:EAL domain-containing protein (putative c-di-GMP-specific phosphodiesterase class I)